MPERKRWWRNLRGGAPVTVLLRAVPRTGIGQVTRDENDAPRVEIELEPDRVQPSR